MDCIFNVYKLPGIVSFNVIRQVRKKFHIRKCGYTGTLDPFASGVLPVFTGNFTKLIPFLDSTVKTYRFTVQWGVRTDTLDITGNVIEKQELPAINQEAIMEAVNKHYHGKFMQIPPQFSAVKVNGKRAYQYARQGKEVSIKPRETEIVGFEVIDVSENGFTGIIEVPRGFYVRAFANDIAEKLNTLGTLTELIRLKDGPFIADNALTVDEIDEHKGIAVEDVMKDYMNIKNIDEEQMELLKRGQPIQAMSLDNMTCMLIAGESIVIGRASNGIMKPVRGIK